MLYSDRLLSQKLERTEARANADFVETRARLFPESGATWIEVGGAYAMFDGADSPTTQTFGLGMFEEATDGHLDEIEMFFRERGSPVFHEVSPMADLALLDLLGRRGYRPVELSSVMFQELAQSAAKPSDPSVQTRRISESEADLWAEISAKGWATEHESLGEFMLGFGRIAARTKGGQPFLAELNGVPSGAAGFAIYDDICIMAGAATIPEARRKGVQNALLAARINYGNEHGCRIAMMATLPGSQSQKNAQKNGFQIAYTRIKWHLP